MRFALSDAQLALAEAATAFLRTQPGPHSHAEVNDRYDEIAWQRLIAEQGWPCILIPEQHGGWSLGNLDLAVVLQAAGAAHTPGPLWCTAGLATPLLLALASPSQQAEWLPRLCAGTSATAALRPAIHAEPVPGGWHLHGTADLPDGDTAELILVNTQAGWFYVPNIGIERSRLPSLDPTRPFARLTLDQRTDARLPGTDPSRALHQARVALAAEQVGLADAALAASVQHLTVRQQFGRPIGSFQALQHAAADMCVAVESARAAVWYAAAALDHDLPDAGLHARTASALAGEAAMLCAGQAIQLHGGIGFTWEHRCHLVFKRARANLSLIDTPADERAAVAETLLGAA